MQVGQRCPDTVSTGRSLPMRDDRGSRSLARPSTAPQPPEHPTKRRPQRVAWHPNVRHQTPLVHAASRPAHHAHAHKKPYLSLRRGPSPEPPPREHAPHPHRQPELPTHAHAAPPPNALGGRPVSRSLAGPRRRRRSTNGTLSSRPLRCWPNRQEGPVSSSRTSAVTTTPGPTAGL